VPTSAHSTIRAALDPWLGSDHGISVILSPRVTTTPTADALLGTTYRVTAVRVGRAMTDELATVRPDVVVVDASTGDYDVVRLCRDVRDSSPAPIVAVVAPDRGDDDAFVIDLLDAGALVVVPVGVSTDRLLAHVRAALRVRPPQETTPILTVGDVVIDLDAHVLSIGGQVVNCAPLLFSLLATLASTPNKVTTREALLTRVWGVEPGTVDTRRVRVAASLLRRLLGAGPRRPRLETVSRIGYRLTVD
jgi:DNA-binding response OmpR family regulator